MVDVEVGSREQTGLVQIISEYCALIFEARECSPGPCSTRRKPGGIDSGRSSPP